MRNIFKGSKWGRGRRRDCSGSSGAGQGAVLLGLTRREFRRRARRAAGQMTPLQRDILRQLAQEDASYEQLAQRHAISVDMVAAQFEAGLLVLADAFDEPPRCWQRSQTR